MTASGPTDGLSSVPTAPPKVPFTSDFNADPYARLRKSIVIRQDDDRIVALIDRLAGQQVEPSRDSGVRPEGRECH